MSDRDEASSSHDDSGPGNNTVYGRPDYSNGFPSAYVSDSTEAIQTIYAQSLFHLGNGLPLLSPQGSYNEDDELQRKTGVVVGDVGFIAKRGAFNVLFNIFTSRNSNPSLRPRQYEAIQPPLEDWKTRTVADHFARGTVLTSKGIRIVDPEAPQEYQFACPYSRGGVLVLPDGGSRTDMEDMDRLHPYIEKHALDWYRFANDYDYNGVYNGALHLVTGADHAHKWATAVVAVNDEFDSEVQFEYDRESNIWPPSTYLEPGSVSDGDPTRPQSGTIFVRTMTIALGSALWTRYAPSLSPSEEPKITILTPPLVFEARQSRFNFLNLLAKKRGRVQRKPISDELMHLSVLLLQIMLSKTPSANVAAVHSSIWDVSSGLDFDYPNILDHIARIFRINTVVIRDGLSVLVSDATVNAKSPAPWRALVTRLLATLATPHQAWATRRERDQLWRTIRRVPDQQSRN